MLAKLREFGEVLHRYGWPLIGFIFALMVVLALGSLFFGPGGTIFIFVSGMIVIAIMSIASKIASKKEFIWMAFVTLTTFVILCLFVNVVAKDASQTTIGWFCSAAVSWLIAVQYAGSGKKKAYQNFAIFACAAYLISVSAYKGNVTVKRVVDSLNTSVKNRVASMYTGSQVPAEVLITEAGFPEDLRTGARDAMGDFILSNHVFDNKEPILYYPELIDPEDVRIADELYNMMKEPYAKIRYTERGKYVFAWLSFRILEKNLNAKNVAKTGDNDPVAKPPAPVAFAIPHDPWIKLADGTLTVDLVSGQTVKKDYDLSPNDVTPWFLIPSNYYVIRFDDDENPDH